MKRKRLANTSFRLPGSALHVLRDSVGERPDSMHGVQRVGLDRSEAVSRVQRSWREPGTALHDVRGKSPERPIPMHGVR